MASNSDSDFVSLRVHPPALAAPASESKPSMDRTSLPGPQKGTVLHCQYARARAREGKAKKQKGVVEAELLETVDAIVEASTRRLQQTWKIAKTKYSTAARVMHNFKQSVAAHAGHNCKRRERHLTMDEDLDVAFRSAPEASDVARAHGLTSTTICIYQLH